MFNAGEPCSVKGNDGLFIIVDKTYAHTIVSTTDEPNERHKFVHSYIIEPETIHIMEFICTR